MASPRPAAPVTGGAPSAAVLDPIRLIKQNKWLLLAATVVGVVIGLGLYFFFRQYSPSYRSSITYQASPPEFGGKKASQRSHSVTSPRPAAASTVRSRKPRNSACAA